MDKARLYPIIRSIFIGLNGLIIIAGVVSFIVGNIFFSERVGFNAVNIRVYFSGSFIGGQLSSLAILFIVYGYLGIYAARKMERTAVFIYASIALISLLTRLLFWVLAAMHGVQLQEYMYAYAALEISILLLSGLLYYVIE